MGRGTEGAVRRALTIKVAVRLEIAGFSRATIVTKRNPWGDTRSAPQRSQAGVAPLIVIGTVAVFTVMAAAAVLERESRHHAVEVHFWFDGVTCELARWETQLGGPLTPRECDRIRALSLLALRDAYDGLPVLFAEGPGRTYRIRVLQDFPPRRGPANPVGLARPMGLLGGEAAVSFRGSAALAFHHAPPDARRDEIVEGIARGIGRTAAHELAHLMLSGERVPGTTDPLSYEYESPDRAEQYYGVLHWDTAWPLLVRKLGPHQTTRDAAGAPTR